MENARFIQIEVAYAMPHRQLIIPLQVDEGCTMVDAVGLSQIADKFPEIDLGDLSLGIFGKAEKSPESRVLKTGDRIEIYRPLLVDPKEVRRKRAEKLKAEKERGSA
ncbi:MAG: RnfH family protein [Pseudomonadales bacterium]|nr:RnfH family protein [Pseudomonadales bacterium]